MIGIFEIKIPAEIMIGSFIGDTGTHSMPPLSAYLKIKILLISLLYSYTGQKAMLYVLPGERVIQIGIVKLTISQQDLLMKRGKALQIF